MIDRILVAGGGTGGHLFPGIAVVEEIRRRLPRVEVLFVGTERGIEARVLPSLGERFVAVDVRPLVGRRPADLARGLWTLPRSAWQAFSVLRSFRPEVAIGLGGYASGPVLLAAAASRIPCALLEQNAHVGLTNRMLGKSVGRAYLTYPQTAAAFGAERTRVLGNPVRRTFVEAARMAGHDPSGVEARSRSVLVLGGSQGARALNEIVPRALARAGVAELGISIVHQTGVSMVTQVEDAYSALGLSADVVPFIDDVAKAYVRASLVIARAGATTLAELCAVGRPAILVPFPHAARDHQTGNARALQSAGAAVSVAEQDLTAERLASEVGGLLRDPGRRRAMAEAARRAGRPDAAAAIVDDLLAWLGTPGETLAVEAHEPGSQNEHGHRAAEPKPDATPRLAVQRRPKIKRAELRIRAIEAAMDALPSAVGG